MTKKTIRFKTKPIRFNEFENAIRSVDACADSTIRQGLREAIALSEEARKAIPGEYSQRRVKRRRK